MLNHLNFFYSQPSTLPKDAPAKFYFSATFGLSFIMSSVAPTRSSTTYAYLITKIRNRNLNVLDVAFALLEVFEDKKFFPVHKYTMRNMSFRTTRTAGLNNLRNSVKYGKF